MKRKASVETAMRRWVDRELGRYRAALTKDLRRTARALDDLIADPEKTHIQVARDNGFSRARLGELVYRWSTRGIDVPARIRPARPFATRRKRLLEQNPDRTRPGKIFAPDR